MGGLPVIAFIERLALQVMLGIKPYSCWAV